VLNARVQIAPRSFFHTPFHDLIDAKLITVDPALLKAVDLQATIKPLPDPPQPPYAALKEKYKALDVPTPRFGFTQVQKLLEQPLSIATLGRVAAKGGKTEATVLPALSKISDVALSTDLSGI